MGTESTSRGRATGPALGACTALIALAVALPALANPVGSQVRISQMGPDGNAGFEGRDPDVAYNPTTNQSLAVWEGDNGPTNGEDEIFGRLIDANGNPIGVQVRLSDMGVDGNANFDARDPAVTYNPQTNEFLAVWEGDDVTDNEFEIYGQRVTSSGAEIGNNDFRISDMGPDGNANFDAGDPAVAYNSQTNEFLVAFDGDDDTAPLVDNEREIFGQRLSAGGNQAGPNDFRISDLGPNGNANFDAEDPTVAYSATSNEFLVAFEGDDGPPLADNEREIWGQRLTATGAETGTNDFRISDMGPDGNANFDAYDPNAVWNSQLNQYLVAFEGDDDTPPLVNNEFEMHGQLLNAAGAEIGNNDFRISDMGPDGNANFDAGDSRRIAYSSQGNEYLVTWEGDDDTAPLVDNEREVFGQRLDALGLQIGTNDFRISQMGPDGNANFDAGDPATTYNSKTNQYQTVWEADDNPPLAPNEEEIFGRRATSGAAPPTPDTTAPVLSLRGSRNQRLQNGVRLRVRTNEDTTVKATGVVRYPGARASARVRLRVARRTLVADRRRTVRLRLTRRGRRAVRRAIRRAKRLSTRRARRRALRRIRVRVKVSATDAAQNRTTKRRTVRAR